ncbi:glycosyltransferase family 2 protein [Paenibacillus rhizovicinus]|uniref:Glycosyltransferase family 2 protein n=1 Tax=Paenibacillus rhizovicinus TaxID=2704463 RepID=A0A6C0NZ91_9BACL|nr:glycosyltransferase family 2 protein [Paenibacillus rhizovicinus]QHW31537.1 glycosyltransferase family 2 protein [Paenibacillus rhizovicinus]
MPTNPDYRVSVIIPTYNAGPEFERLLRRLQSQSQPPYEIIVIDSASTDGTAETARRVGVRVIPIAKANFDHGGTRNAAAKQSKGDTLLFMTQDAYPDDDYLIERLIEALYAEEDTACAYARQIAREDADGLERMARENNYPPVSIRKQRSDLPRLGIKTFFCSNVCAAYKKTIFDELGQFDAPVLFNEDLFFAARCVLNRYAVRYVAEARVIHSHHYTVMQQFRRYFDNGVSMRDNEWVYPYASVGKAGSSLVRQQLQFLIRSRRWLWIPKLVADAGAKLLGFQLGKRYRKLPPKLCVRFSMHRGIWAKLNAAGREQQSVTGMMK